MSDDYSGAIEAARAGNASQLIGLLRAHRPPTDEDLDKLADLVEAAAASRGGAVKKRTISLLDDKGEVAKVPGDAVRAKLESRDLTEEEERKRVADIDAKLEACERAYKKATTSDEHARVVFLAVNLFGGLVGMPYWLLKATLDIVRAQLPKAPKDVWHHDVLRAYLDLRDDAGIALFGWEEAVHLAVEKLKELGEKVSERTLREHYTRVEKTKPEAARRPRTYSRHRRPRPPGQK